MRRLWYTDKWFVSPWNYSPEVAGAFSFPAHVQIHDLTLRDGEQQAGLVLRSEEKIRIAEALAELGVHRIEAGTPAVSWDDERAVREIARRKLGPKIFALARCTVEDVKRVADCGVDGAIVEIPCSEHMLEYCYRWPVEKAIEMSVNATRFAHEQGLYVVFFPIDSTRSDIDWYLTLIERVARDGHMDALALVDTAGVLSPHAVPYMVRAVRERIRKPLEAHFHNDFGLAVANTIAALASGAEVAHCSVVGIGERAGNAPLEDTVVSLLMLYGVDTGLRYEYLTRVARLVIELAGHRIPENRQVVGRTLFHVESGIITDWWRNAGEENILELFPYHWSLVGQDPPKLVLGKKSGSASIQIALEKLGVRATEGQVSEILLRVKEKAIQEKRPLSEREFADIVDQVVSGLRGTP
jgi:isopropylmalate/homocitrate/citramalate synthase